MKKSLQIIIAATIIGAVSVGYKDEIIAYYDSTFGEYIEKAKNVAQLSEKRSEEMEKFLDKIN